jgi:hypothetical protein
MLEVVVGTEYALLMERFQLLMAEHDRLKIEGATKTELRQHRVNLAAFLADMATWRKRFSSRLSSPPAS